MSDVAITMDPRARALSFTAAALVVALSCTLLLLVSRVVEYAEQHATGVEVFLEEAPRPAAPVRTEPPPRSGISVLSADAPSTPTTLPLDAALLSHALACLDRLSRDRPADCPRETIPRDRQDEARTRSAYDPFPRALPPIDLPMGIDPPCVPGFHVAGAGIAGCIKFGITPPPPSRSAEEICAAGGIGPCQPPPFREVDVVRRAHTQ